jgi:PAS domain S-box-containing protein
MKKGELNLLRRQVEELKTEIAMLQQKQVASRLHTPSDWESEELLNSTQRLSKVGGWEWSIEKQTMFWTEETYRIHDFVIGELVPGSPEHIEKSLTCYDPADRFLIHNAFLNCAERGEPYDLELPFTTAAGRKLWVRTTAQPVWENDRIVSVVGNIMDITDRKCAQVQLAESERKLSTLMANLPGMAYRCLNDESWTMKFVSNGSFELTGMEADHLVDNQRTSYLELIHPDDRVMVQETIRKRLAKREQFNLTYRIFDATGKEKWVLEKGQGIFTDTGELTAIEGFITDITERRQSEEALRLSEEKFRLAFQTSPDSINLNRLSDGMYIDINEGFTNLTGYTREDAIGKTSIELNIWYDPKDRERLVKGLTKDGYVKNLEAKFQGKHGQIKTALMSARVLDLNQEKVILSISRDITEYKRAKEALRESEARFRSLVESSPDAIFVQSAGRFVYLNSAACRLFGASQPGDLLGKDFMERMVLEYRDKIQKRIKVQTETGKPVPLMDQEYIRLDGSRVAVESTAVPIRYKGEAAHMVLIRDITERKRKEKALRESEARYRTLIENIPQAVLLKDRESKYISINKPYALAFGLRQEEVVGKSDYDFHPKHFADKFRQEDRLVMETGEGRVFDEENVQDGQRRTYHKVKVPVRDSMGKIVGVLSTLSDITERRQAEETLRESEERHRTIIEASSDAILLRSSDGVVIYANPAAIKLFRANHSTDLIGKQYLDFVHPDDRALSAERVKKSLDENWIATPREHRILALDGQVVSVESIGGIVKHRGEIQIFGVFRDISERKKSEKKIEEWRQLMDFIIRHDPNAIAVYDENLRYVFVSDRYLSDYKVKDHNIIGKHHYEVFPEMPGRWKQVHQRVLAGAVERSEEDRFERLDGSVDYNRWECRPWYRLDGSIGGMITYTEVISERKRVEEALRKSEATFNSFMEHCPVYVFIKDENTRAIRLSRNYEQLLGKPVEDLLGKTMDELLPSEMAKKMVEDDLSVIRGGKPIKVVEELDGRIYETTKFPIIQPDKSSLLAGFTVDITDRRRTEEALLQSEELYRGMFENASIGITRVSLDGIYREVNPAMTRILGYSPAELTGRPVAGFTYPDDLERRAHFLSDLIEGRIVSGEQERRFVHKNGSVVWTLITASVQRDQSGKPLYFISLVQDITDRKLAEEALRLSQARYRTLVENIPQSVLLKDLESRYVSANKAFATSLGLSPMDVIGKTDYDLYPKDRAEKYREEDRQVIKTGESREYQSESVEDGNKRFFHKVKVPVRDNEGNIIGVLTSLLDITERLQLEEQFRHSQKMEAAGRLAGGVAHDFNNLLTVIGGHTEIALARIDKNNPILENLQEAKIAADRASKLTRQLLAFSRRQVMEIKVLDLNTVIRDTEKMLCRLLGEDIAVITQPAENLGLVKADPGQIEQVLTNLAVNARDAMPEGGRLVIATDNLKIAKTVNSKHDSLKPGRYVRMSVSDTGHGMDSEVMSKIFEPFFTTKEQGKGTGLGLSTVFGIVKQSGGEIRVHSKLNKGTTFEIVLPRIGETELVIKKENPKEPPKGTEAILIIEDEASVLNMAAHILKDQGYQVLKASGIEDAMRVFEEHPGPIDLVLTDVVMPVCRGPALVERLKQYRDNFKVLYMSGYTDGGIGDLGVLRRGDNFIQKPFTLESLANKVRSVLDGE